MRLAMTTILLGCGGLATAGAPPVLTSFAMVDRDGAGDPIAGFTNEQTVRVEFVGETGSDVEFHISQTEDFASYVPLPSVTTHEIPLPDTGAQVFTFYARLATVADGPGPALAFAITLDTTPPTETDLGKLAFAGGDTIGPDINFEVIAAFNEAVRTVSSVGAVEGLNGASVEADLTGVGGGSLSFLPGASPGDGPFLGPNAYRLLGVGNANGAGNIGIAFRPSRVADRAGNFLVPRVDGVILVAIQAAPTPTPTPVPTPTVALPLTTGEVVLVLIGLRPSSPLGDRNFDTLVDSADVIFAASPE